MNFTKNLLILALTAVTFVSCQKDLETESVEINQTESIPEFRSGYDSEYRKDFFREIAKSKYEIGDTDPIVDYTSFLEALSTKDVSHLYPAWDHQFKRSIVSFSGDEYVAFTPVFITPNATKDEAMFLMSHLKGQEVKFLYLRYQDINGIIESGRGTSSDDSILPMFKNWEELPDYPQYYENENSGNSFVVFRGQIELECIDFSFCQFDGGCASAENDDSPDADYTINDSETIEFRVGGCPCGYAWTTERVCFWTGTSGGGSTIGGSTGGPGSTNPSGNGAVLGGGGRGSGTMSGAVRNLLSQSISEDVISLIGSDFDLPETPEEFAIFDMMLDLLLEDLCPNDTGLLSELKEFVQAYIKDGGTDIAEGIREFFYQAGAKSSNDDKIKCLREALRERNTLYNHLRQTYAGTDVDVETMISAIGIGEILSSVSREGYKTKIINELNSMSDLTASIVQDQNTNPNPNPVYYNRYGYNGITQIIDGNWWHSRWNYNWNEEEHFKLSNNTWISDVPPTHVPFTLSPKDFIQAIYELRHEILDAAGMIPVIGIAADGINTVLYFYEGDMANAALSATAIIPVVGNYATAAKWLKSWKRFFDDGLSTAFRRNPINLSQRTIIDDWAGDIATASNKRKGNFGEIGADLDLNAKGYESLQPRIDGIDSPGHNGLDGAYKKNGQYFIVEGKYSGSANLNPANPATGLPKQMTDDWISQNDWQRLRDAVGTDVADDIIATGYKRILAKTASDGTVTYDELDAAANIIGDWTP